MEPVIPTTPFGRRSLTLAHVAAQVGRLEEAPGQSRPQVEGLSGPSASAGLASAFGAGAACSTPC